VTIIPEPEKANYTEAKAHHPISLLFFMQAAMEKLVDRHNRDDMLGLCPLHQYKCAYQPGNPLQLHCTM
jgi:hypothetical protein